MVQRPKELIKFHKGRGSSHSPHRLYIPVVINYTTTMYNVVLSTAFSMCSQGHLIHSFLIPYFQFPLDHFNNNINNFHLEFDRRLDNP